MTTAATTILIIINTLYFISYKICFENKSYNASFIRICSGIARFNIRPIAVVNFIFYCNTPYFPRVNLFTYPRRVGKMLTFYTTINCYCIEYRHCKDVFVVPEQDFVTFEVVTVAILFLPFLSAVEAMVVVAIEMVVMAMEMVVMVMETIMMVFLCFVRCRLLAIGMQLLDICFYSCFFCW